MTARGAKSPDDTHTVVPVADSSGGTSWPRTSRLATLNHPDSSPLAHGRPTYQAIYSW
jgi:hypothetical protein